VGGSLRRPPPGTLGAPLAVPGALPALLGPLPALAGTLAGRWSEGGPQAVEIGAAVEGGGVARSLRGGLRPTLGTNGPPPPGFGAGGPG
jgi:hypothetical protein